MHIFSIKLWTFDGFNFCNSCLLHLPHRSTQYTFVIFNFLHYIKCAQTFPYPEPKLKLNVVHRRPIEITFWTPVFRYFHIPIFFPPLWTSVTDENIKFAGVIFCSYLLFLFSWLSCRSSNFPMRRKFLHKLSNCRPPTYFPQTTPSSLALKHLINR